jgi:SAM-dependent methyltransferase
MTARAIGSSVAGTATVVGFNWPKYLAAGALLAVAATADRLGLPGPIRSILWLGGVLGAVWAATSLAATWWVYDHSRVYDEVAKNLGPLGDWASVHCGFDESTPTLTRAIGCGPVQVVDLAIGSSASLRRARGRQVLEGCLHRPEAPALAPSSLDSIFVTFAAHEVRDRTDQRDLFSTVARALRPGGRLVITEHLRDLANFAVYGPGALHFQHASTWRARAVEAGLALDRDSRITPFVHRMVWTR